MITEDAIINAMAKQMKNDIDREVLEKVLEKTGPRFVLGPYRGESRAVRVRYRDEEITRWIEQHPPGSWRQVGYFVDNHVYILDEQLYTMFVLRWSS